MVGFLYEVRNCHNCPWATDLDYSDARCTWHPEGEPYNYIEACRLGEVRYGQNREEITETCPFHDHVSSREPANPVTDTT